MKGKSTFTQSEIDQIKKLISEKVKASPDKQKGIRQKIRNLKFYYSDFESQKDAYNVADFETLIRSGRIKVIGGIPIKSIKENIPKAEKKVTTVKKIKVSNTETNTSQSLSSILNIFAKNSFDPFSDSESKIPDACGNYIICMKAGVQFPDISIKPSFKTFEGLKVIYTGIAGSSLRNRDYKQHFKGNNAGRSTLRKSLGVLFGCTQIPRDKDPSTGKTKFNEGDENNLTLWMCQNLIMYFLPNSDFNGIEIELINYFNPPLNIKDNHNPVNREFRASLSQLRGLKSQR